MTKKELIKQVARMSKAFDCGMQRSRQLFVYKSGASWEEKPDEQLLMRTYHALRQEDVRYELDRVW